VLDGAGVAEVDEGVSYRVGFGEDFGEVCGGQGSVVDYQLAVYHYVDHIGGAD
jgi:hypothetical protein